MVNLRRFYWPVYFISMGVMAYITRPWEAGWGSLWKVVPVLIGTAVIILLLHKLNTYSERRGIGEAQFDGKTGKQIDND